MALTRSFAGFNDKLKSKGQSDSQRRQARRSVAIYYRMIGVIQSSEVLSGKLLYGCGLSSFECLKLRVQDSNFDMKVLTVHDGKGQKDRTLPMPEILTVELTAQVACGGLA